MFTCRPTREWMPSRRVPVVAPLMSSVASTVGQSGLEIVRLCALSGAMAVVDSGCKEARLRLLTGVLAMPALKGRNRACHRQLGGSIRPKRIIITMLIVYNSEASGVEASGASRGNPIRSTNATAIVADAYN